MPPSLSRDAAIDEVADRAADRDHTRHFPTTGDSFLATELEVLCLWGFISATLVQRLAHAYKLDQENMSLPMHPRLERLAKLGNSGIYAGNIRRDFYTMLTATVACMLGPLWIRIPYTTQKNTQGDETQWQSLLPIMMPNVVIEHVWNHFANSHITYLHNAVPSGSSELGVCDACRQETCIRCFFRSRIHLITVDKNSNITEPRRVVETNQFQTCEAIIDRRCMQTNL